MSEYIKRIARLTLSIVQPKLESQEVKDESCQLPLLLKYQIAFQEVF